tara:strand:+ start:1950 stop:2207 length:258 start_codon:yes stop_codon:yes gene_type:complete
LFPVISREETEQTQSGTIPVRVLSERFRYDNGLFRVEARDPERRFSTMLSVLSEGSWKTAAGMVPDKKAKINRRAFLRRRYVEVF